MIPTSKYSSTLAKIQEHLATSNHFPNAKNSTLKETVDMYNKIHGNNQWKIPYDFPHKVLQAFINQGWGIDY